MSQFPLIDYQDISDPEIRTIYDEIRTELGFGVVPNLFKSMATSQTFLASQWQQFRMTMLQGQLPRTLKEMIGIVISQANQSPYALQVHLHSLSVLGISEAVLKQLVNNFEECPLPARPKAVIRFGLLCATQPQMLDTSHFAELRDEGLTDSEITEVMATAMLFLSINRYTDSIALEIDQL